MNGLFSKGSLSTWCMTGVAVWTLHAWVGPTFSEWFTQRGGPFSDASGPSVHSTATRAARSQRAVSERLNDHAARSGDAASVDAFLGNSARTRSSSDDLHARLTRASDVQKKLSRCLRLRLCIQRVDPHSPYYDPTNTIEHRRLNSALKFLAEAIGDNAAYTSYVRISDIEETLQVEAPETQSLALDLLFLKAPVDAWSESLALKASLTLGSARLHYLDLLTDRMDQAGTNAESKQARFYLLSTLSETFADDDMSLSLSVIRRLKDYDLNAEEAASCLAHLCAIRTNPAQAHNWTAVVRLSEAYLQEVHPDVNFTARCGSN